MNNIKKILIVEVHADDSLFSKFEFNKAFKEGIIKARMDIVTLASDRESKEFAVEGGYASDATFEAIPHSFFGDRPTQHREVNRLHKEGVNLDEYYLEYIDKNCRGQVALINNALAKIDYSQYDFVITVVGSMHMDHMITRARLINLIDDTDKLIFCTDMPYAKRVYGRKLHESAVLNIGSQIGELKKCDQINGSFGKEKVNCLKKYYPTEVGFLRFDRDKVEAIGEFYTSSDKALEFVNKMVAELNQYVEGSDE